MQQNVFKEFLLPIEITSGPPNHPSVLPNPVLQITRTQYRDATFKVCRSQQRVSFFQVLSFTSVFNLVNRTLGTEIVTIYVGPKRKSFSIHKKLLCSRSEYFDKAFNGGFKESDGTMYLPEDDPEAFDALVVYIYQNRLLNFPSERFSADCECCDSGYTQQNFLSSNQVLHECPCQQNHGHPAKYPFQVWTYPKLLWNPGTLPEYFGRKQDSILLCCHSLL